MDATDSGGLSSSRGRSVSRPGSVSTPLPASGHAAAAPPQDPSTHARTRVAQAASSISAPVPTHGGLSARPAARALGVQGSVTLTPRRRLVSFLNERDQGHQRQHPVEDGCSEHSSLLRSRSEASSPVSKAEEATDQGPKSAPKPFSVPALDLSKLHTPTPPPPSHDTLTSAKKGPPRRCQSSYTFKPSPSPRLPPMRAPSEDGNQTDIVASLLQEAEQPPPERVPSRPESPSMDSATQREREAIKARQQFCREREKERETESLSPALSRNLPPFKLPSLPSSSLQNLPQEDTPSPRRALKPSTSSESMGEVKRGLRKTISGSAFSLVPHLVLGGNRGTEDSADPLLMSQRSKLLPSLNLGANTTNPEDPVDPPLASQRSRLLPTRTNRALTPSKSTGSCSLAGSRESLLSEASQLDAGAASGAEPFLDPLPSSVAPPLAHSHDTPGNRSVFRSGTPTAIGHTPEQTFPGPPLGHSNNPPGTGPTPELTPIGSLSGLGCPRPELQQSSLAAVGDQAISCDGGRKQLPAVALPQSKSAFQSGSEPHTMPWPLSARSSPLSLGSPRPHTAAAAAAAVAGDEQQRSLTHQCKRPSRATREAQARESLPQPFDPSGIPERKLSTSLVAGARRRRSWLDGISSNSPLGFQSPRLVSQAGSAQPSPTTGLSSLSAADGLSTPQSSSTASDFSELFEREVSAAQAEKFASFKRMREENEQLAKYNPSAFSEEAAQAEAAKSREVFEEARQRLDALGLACSIDDDGKYTNSINLLQASRPFFIAPVAAKRQVIDKQFDLDYSRMCTKSRLKRMLLRTSADAAGTSLDEGGLYGMMQLLRAELRKHACTIRSAFAYYSCLSGNTSTLSMLSMRLMEYIRFTQSACIPDQRSPACKPSDVDTIFSATSFADTDESRGLGGNTLVRFEFLEVLVRLAVAKYIIPRTCTSVCEAVSKLFIECIEPNLTQIAQPDPNQFRRDRLYCQDMETLVLQHWDLLNAMYRLYKAPDRSKTLQIEGWLELLEGAQLTGATCYTGVDKSCAKALFCFSQATVTDELGKRQRAVSLAFFDFVEALARLSEVLAPPPPAELAAWFEAYQQQAARDADSEMNPKPSTPRPPSSMPPAMDSRESVWPNVTAPTSSRSATPRRPPGRSKSTSMLMRSRPASGRFSSLGAAAEGPRPQCPIDAWFQELPYNPELAEKREEEGGLGGPLHLRAQQIPLSASFGPFMELLASRMQSIWGGKSMAETVARMTQQSESTIGLQARR